MSHLDELTRDTIEDLLLKSEGPVFVDVWGTQCQPCLALAPTYEKLAARFGTKGRFLKLEAPKNRMACVDLRVMGLPTFFVYVDGSEQARISGEAISAVDLTEWVENELAKVEGGER